MQDIDNLVNRLSLRLPSPIQQLPVDWCPEGNLSVYVKRDDLIHPIISGNKWRKLQGHLTRSPQLSKQALPRQIVSFGGGYSNHLHSLGYCCQQLNIKLHAIVRGNYQLNPTPMLQDIENWGANIHYVTKMEYQQRHDNVYLEQLSQTYPEALIIPEGGSDEQALEGVANIIAELSSEPNYQFDYILCPVASGGTLAGLNQAIYDTKLSTKLIGIAVLKGAVLEGEDYLEELVEKLQSPNVPKATILHDYHCGGYAKAPDYLKDFCSQFNAQYGIPVEPVYSGKLFYALKQLIESGYFPAQSRILILHTGGLQGARV
ncbi:pyridoxal-phosphate dependent enzyme [Paraneptunicella aestuarii]|uniref:1-aminocyclopropane-1-carboxylate deaminase/D-cysteine desulfhydrase n=1 Tax=Paraneptunicella aestuarii TaxID=2831148 RepID=UPI001E319BA4|nr:pyridoxal-phosphate dependent enzyme [Paraneptunicella aestuarii]UAA39768.1 pyridoxal-phosphate dependent enzyme [Paraneptunicella aestuarii]